MAPDSELPEELNTLFGAVNTIAKVTSDLTDGKFELQPFAAGEIVPGLQVLDAVSNGTVECGFTYMGYYIGKNPAAIFDASLPFGLTPRMHQAWLQFGGGRQLVDELYDGFGVVAITAGNTGGQMFGWFRKELKTVKDFEGLKMRTAGFGGKVMAKLGVIARRSPAATSIRRWRRHDRRSDGSVRTTTKLGFNKVATTTRGRDGARVTNQLMISKKAGDSAAALPAALRAAGSRQPGDAGLYDAKNAEAIACRSRRHAASIPPDEIIKARRRAEQCSTRRRRRRAVQEDPHELRRRAISIAARSPTPALARGLPLGAT